MNEKSFGRKMVLAIIYSIVPWVFLYLLELPLYKWFWFFGALQFGFFSYLIPLITYAVLGVVGFIASIILYPVYVGIRKISGGRWICLANWTFGLNLAIVLFFLITNRLSLGFQSSGFIGGARWLHIVFGVLISLIVVGALFIAVRRKAPRDAPDIPFRIGGLVLLGVVLLLLSIAYNSPRVLSSERNLKNSPNILIITLDTSNIHYIPGYGSPDFVAPNIAELVKDSILFENAYCSVPLTTPSHASIFTGAHPQHHKAYSNESKVPMKVKMASEFFKSKGYLTAGFPSALCVTSVNKFDQGFDYFMNRHRDDNIWSNIYRQLAPFRFLDVVLGLNYVRADIPDNSNADFVSNKFMRWLRKSKERRFFAWLHYFDLHAPYLPPDKTNDTRAAQLGDVEVNLLPASVKSLTCLFGSKYWEDQGLKPRELTDEEITFIRNLYREELMHLDKSLGNIIEKLKELNLYDNTVIAVIGDHGEGLYERGYFGHNFFLNEDEIRIPMFIHIPGVESKKISWIVESIDLLPTLIDYANLKVPSKFSFESKDKTFGRSLRGLIEENPEIVPYWQKPALSQIFIYSRAIRVGDWKLVWGLNKGERVFRYNCNEYHLIDIKNDPAESVNLFDTYPDIGGDLIGKLEESMRVLEDKKNFRTIPFRNYINAKTNEDDKKLIETLIGLGYLSGAQIEKMLSSDWSYDDSLEDEGIYLEDECGCRGREQEDVSIQPWELPKSTTEGV